MRNLVALAIAGAVSAASMNASDYKFIRYIVEHNKEYKTVEEFVMRQANFLNMDIEIERLNQNSTSVHGHNYLSDWTREEYQMLLGLKNMPKPAKASANLFTAT
jgi:hypothetical protein